MSHDNNMEPRVFRPGEPDALDALRSELVRVTVSPDFSNRVKTALAWSPGSLDPGAQSADPGTRLESELNVIEVSPAFAVRVRAAVEQDASRPRWFQAAQWWRQSVPATVLAAAAVIAIVWISVRSLRTEQAPVIVATLTPAPLPPAQTSSQTPSQTPAQSIDAPVATRSSAAHVRPGVARPAPVRATTVAPVPAVDPLSEVITNQPEVIRQLWLRVAPDAALASGDPAAGVLVTAGEIAIPPIEVNPIVVKSLGDPAAAASGSTPIIRRATADQAERSPK